jgi:hypothetical protein
MKTLIEKTLIDLTGPLARLFFEEQRSDGPAFFRPYRSASDTATGVASIITAPILLSAAAIGVLVLTGYELLKAIGNALIGHFSKASDNLGDCGTGLIFSLLSALAAPFSPLISLIDVIGSIVTTSHGEEAANNSALGQEAASNFEYN